MPKLSAMICAQSARCAETESVLSIRLIFPKLYLDLRLLRSFRTKIYGDVQVAFGAYGLEETNRARARLDPSS